LGEVGAVTFAGIDYSTFFVDIVLVSDADLAHRRISLRGPDSYERVRELREQMPTGEEWRDEGVVAVGIEEPRGKGNGALLRVQGALLALLPRYMLVHPMAPQTWRKTIGLKGSGCRAELKLASTDWSLEHGGDIGWPEDAHEAHCMARAVQMLTKEGA
jgi:hypothetical protein